MLTCRFEPCNTIKRLLFECPASLSAPYSPPEDWFATVGNKRFLVLWVDREKYTPIRDQGELQYRDTLSGPFAPIRTARVGFEAVIDDHCADKLYLVEEIAYGSASADLRKHTPIKVLDYVRPERSDRIAAPVNGEPVTVRLGRILSIQEGGGMVSRKCKLYGLGFTIRFQEECKRRILG
ncbi:MAG: hypothetical protein QNJ46_09585 [Leptolyngbyaceae cyanobacterium MO_188.B28]|nr:hypothetical protein [Leptolyngbyaceae cyanobacterium MO_188.B28]